MASAFDGPIPGRVCKSDGPAVLILIAPVVEPADFSDVALAAAAGGFPSLENTTSGVILANVAGPIPETASRSDKLLNGPFCVRC